ncbi:MAG: anti-sigma factor [Ilumatobacter sp.]|uniref:anti-sigma factor n=1 Tax=Ilumatobacter sp. TaxID=1967498 RepID=UPI00262C5E01|nr:anti-sigma factor [Ilumatobacter sp.]MDJ0769246.1 anti-sigma factor [Ilumatobacter sp.]
MSDTTGHDDLSRVEALLNELDASDLELLDPPADVWAGIEAELGDEAVATPADIAPVVSLAERRNRWMRPVLAVAAAAAIVVVGAAVVFTGDDAEVLAAADLTYDAAAFDPLGEGASATAELVEGDDGFEIVLTDSSLPSDLAENADLELWLIEADADGNLVDVASVALVEGAGSYAVPASIDVDTHRIVDISVEPRDGDDAHSGRSILRGTLDA